MNLINKFATSILAAAALGGCSQNECGHFPKKLARPDDDFFKGKLSSLPRAEVEKADRLIKKCYGILPLNKYYTSIKFQSVVESPIGRKYFIYKSAITTDIFIVFQKNRDRYTIDKAFPYYPNGL